MIEMNARYKGAAAIAISSDQLCATVVPEQGGHISSLYSVEEERELLWQSGEEAYRSSSPGSLFESGECAGIDDMFPNAAACTIQSGPSAGVQLPDHGETWTLPCESVQALPNAVCFTMRGKLLCYLLKKTVSICGSTLRVDYRAENTGNQDFPFLWAAHPLFRAEDYSGLSVPGAAEHVSLPFCFGKRKASGRMHYPLDRWDDATAAQLNRIPEETGHLGYKFIFESPVSVGRCVLMGKPGTGSVEVAFPADRVPFLGVWVDAGGNEEAPAYVVAPEPSTHGSVDLNDAAPSKAKVLRAHESFEWWIQYTLKYRGENYA